MSEKNEMFVTVWTGEKTELFPTVEEVDGRERINF